MHAFAGLGFTPLSMLPSAAAVLENNITVTGISDITLDVIGTYNHNITVTGISDIIFDVIGTYNHSIAVTGISDIAVIYASLNSIGLVITGQAGFASLPGYSYFNSVPIEGLANLTIFSGFTYNKTLNIDGIANFTFVEEYINQEFLTIASSADLDLDVLQNINPSFIIAGFSSIVLAHAGNIQNTIIIAGFSQVFIEQIYDILIVSAGIATISIQEQRVGNLNEIPAASGAVSVSCQAIFSRSVIQTLALNQTIIAKKPTGIIGDGLTLSQTITVKKVKNLSVIHTLNLTQVPEAFRSIEHTLLLDQEIEFVIAKPRVISHALNLTQTIGLNVVYNRSISHTLIFNVDRETRLPIINGTQFSYFAPLIDFVLVPKKCLVILSVPSQTVVLPCPLFGDSQAYQGSLTLKRTMTGGTRTYVRQTLLQKLEYQFEIWTQKWQELRNFILNHSHRQIRLDNWKGESWIVNMMNNPVEFAAEGRYQPKGEKYTVTLSFEGVKLHG